MDRTDERESGSLTGRRPGTGDEPAGAPQSRPTAGGARLPAGGEPVAAAESRLPAGHRSPLRAAIERGDFDRFLERCDFAPPGTPVTCAVSGGADSLALLVLATAAGLDVTAVHVDHGLRPGSGADADVVAAAAAAAGAGFRAESVQVAPGPNLEARARSARYGVLPPATLVGHTADDRAETVLLNLLRGSGLPGVAAMPADRRRPLLGLRRTDTREVCRLAGLTPVVDESNSDPAIRRNRVRHEAIPLLNEIFERDVAPLLGRHADLAGEAAEALDAVTADLDPTDAAAVAAAPPALARWVLRRWITEGRGATGPGDEQHPPDLAAVERALAVARQEARATDVGGGWRVLRTSGRLRLESPVASPPRLPD